MIVVKGNLGYETCGFQGLPPDLRAGPPKKVTFFCRTPSPFPHFYPVFFAFFVGLALATIGLSPILPAYVTPVFLALARNSLIFNNLGSVFEDTTIYFCN